MTISNFKSSYWHKRNESFKNNPLTGIKYQIPEMFHWYFTKKQYKDDDDRLKAFARRGIDIVLISSIIDINILALRLRTMDDNYKLLVGVDRYGVLTEYGDEWFRQNVYNTQL